MKHLPAIAAFLLCVLLVAFAPPVMDAARNAVDIWWNTLLPTLFPFFACASLMDSSGALVGAAKLFKPISKRLKLPLYSLPVLFLGGITGYPSGARLCGMLQSKGSIGEDEAQRLATVCNLASPMFIAGALSSGMFDDAGMFAPLAIGHYGAGLLIAALTELICPIKSANAGHIRQEAAEPLYKQLPKSLFSGMTDIIKVGGSVIFFLVLAEILKQTGIYGIIGAPIDALFQSVPGDSPSQGILLGLFEMTGGCHLIVKAGMPLSLSASLCAFLISFGGLSVMVQTLAFVKIRRPWRYLLIKLVHGAGAAGITYAIMISRPGSVSAFVPAPTPYISNAVGGLAVLFACTLGFGAAFLLSLIAGRQKKL